MYIYINSNLPLTVTKQMDTTIKPIENEYRIILKRHENAKGLFFELDLFDGDILTDGGLSDSLKS